MRKPDLVIARIVGKPQTLRWQLINWRGYQLCLHKWLRSDEDSVLHDHKADNISLLLNGRMYEVLAHDWDMATGFGPIGHYLWPLIPYFRKAEKPHRIVLLDKDKPIWSLWFRFPQRRRWGFWCKKGWRDADDFLNVADYYSAGESTTGRGCD